MIKYDAVLRIKMVSLEYLVRPPGPVLRIKMDENTRKCKKTRGKMVKEHIW